MVWGRGGKIVGKRSRQGKEVVIRIQVGGSVSEIIARTNAAMMGSLPSAPGTHQITVEALNTSIVRVSP